MIISIHIPKTAGTTIAYILDYGYSRRIMYDYREDYNNKDSVKFLLKHKEFIEEYFEIIHGHFLYSKYAEVFPESKYIVTVRHPVERVISQYNHIINSSNGDHAWPSKEVISRKMDIVEFSSIDNIGNAQASFIKGREIDDYDHVFLSERLESSIRLFQKKFSFSRQDPFARKGVPVINDHGNRPQYYSPTKEERAAIFNRCKKDVDIYKRATKKHEDEMKALL